MLEVQELKITQKTMFGIKNYDYSFKLNPEVNWLTGNTGIGKTTLLLGLAGLINTLKSKIFIDKKNISNLLPGKKPVNIMFQENNLISKLSIKENILLGLDRKTKKNKNLNECYNMLIDEFRLPKTNKSVTLLSGGQKQLVSAIRLILRSKFKKTPSFERQLILLDEPLIGLDNNMKTLIVKYLEKLSAKFHHIVFISSHDQQFINRYQYKKWEIYAINENSYKISLDKK